MQDTGVQDRRRSLSTRTGAAAVTALLLLLVATAFVAGPLVATARAAGAPEPAPAPGQAFAGEAPSPPAAEAATGEHVVADTTGYPARAVGTLDFVQGGEPGRCTAFLIDRNSVVTAAHCVHDGTGDAPGAWSTDFVFDPGRDGTDTPYRTCHGLAAEAPALWRVDGAETSDYAVVQLDCSVGRRVGWFGLWLSPRGDDLAVSRVKVRGYPGALAGAQWRDDGNVTLTTERLTFHNARTRGDSDGGPLYVTKRACGGPCAVAVQAAEPHGRGVHRRYPHGPRFSGHRWSQILGWATENG